jgi:hypothetical protein
MVLVDQGLCLSKVPALGTFSVRYRFVIAREREVGHGFLKAL